MKQHAVTVAGGLSERGSALSPSVDPVAEKQSQNVGEFILNN